MRREGASGGVGWDGVEGTLCSSYYWLTELPGPVFSIVLVIRNFIQSIVKLWAVKVKKKLILLYIVDIKTMGDDS